LILLKKFAWKPILDAVNDREEGIKTHYFLLKMQRKEMQNSSRQRKICKQD
jgi:F-type H+-transporting ATPase subunit b